MRVWVMETDIDIKFGIRIQKACKMRKRNYAETYRDSESLRLDEIV